ncbi:M20/M25/M40 family metallo-hydrolase [Deltaproteobacteria bacterium TL4]
MTTKSGSELTQKRDLYKRPVELLQNLIRFDTTNPPGNEIECIRYIEGLLKSVGLETQIIAKHRNRPNLIARLPGRGNASPLLLYGHIDVVTTTTQDWKHPPFEARIVDHYLWGRGALDMKGGVAMMLSAFLRAKAENLKCEGDMVLAILSDEEAGSHVGAKYLVEKHPQCFEGIRYGIGEFGGFPSYIGGHKFYPIQVGEKQLCSMKVVIQGPAGHGSVPMRGGAMGKLGQLLSQLNRKRLPVHITPIVRQMITEMGTALSFPENKILPQLLNPKLTVPLLSALGEKGRMLEPMFHNTVNATIVHGGEVLNVIPSEITLGLDGRLLPGFTPDDMKKELRQIVGKKVEFEVVRHDPGPSDVNMGLFATLAKVLKNADPDATPVPMLLPGVTDSRFFSKLGIQSYGFLPMNLPQGFDFFRTIHAANERIPVEAVDFGSDAIFEVLKQYHG